MIIIIIMFVIRAFQIQLIVDIVYIVAGVKGKSQSKKQMVSATTTFQAAAEQANMSLGKTQGATAIKHLWSKDEKDAVELRLGRFFLLKRIPPKSME